MWRRLLVCELEAAYTADASAENPAKPAASTSPCSSASVRFSSASRNPARTWSAAGAGARHVVVPLLGLLEVLLLAEGVPSRHPPSHSLRPGRASRPVLLLLHLMRHVPVAVAVPASAPCLSQVLTALRRDGSGADVLPRHGLGVAILEWPRGDR